MKASFLIYTLTLVPLFIFGKIVETKKFFDITRYIEQALPAKSIVICDLDNTLIIPCEPLGSVAWADDFQGKLQKKGISKKDSELIEHILWKTIQPHIQIKLIDPDTSAVLEDLKDRQIPVLGLTARFPDDAWFTFSQLKSVEIDFSNQNNLPYAGKQVPLEDGACYEKGILFATTNNKKSEVLLNFLKIHKIKPEYVIFVDDKLHHVKDVEQELERQGIQCLGVRFSGADEYVEQFNSSLAEKQWEAFPNM